MYRITGGVFDMDKDGREAGKERERAEKKKISSVSVLLFFAVLFL